MQKKRTSLYDILGISRLASKADIKKAYKKLAAQYHPDRNNNLHSDEFFILIKDAYDVLSDDKQRDEYDKPFYKSVANILRK